jgi:hypothetical protein
MSDEIIKKIDKQVDALVDSVKSLSIQCAINSTLTHEINDKLDEYIDKTDRHETILTKHKVYWKLLFWLVGSSFGVGGLLSIINLLN